MKSMRVSALLATWFVTVAGEVLAQNAIAEQIGKLKAAEAKARTDAATNIMEARKKSIDHLLKLARQKEDGSVIRGTKEISIDLLGALRAHEAVPFLVKHVDYRVAYVSRADNPIQGYPCARALIAIGAASLPEISDRMGRPLQELEIFLFAYIARCIDGEEIGLARLELWRRQAEGVPTEDGPIKRKNLDRLIEHYKTKKTGF